jgi:hypothetical protein
LAAARTVRVAATAGPALIVAAERQDAKVARSAAPIVKAVSLDVRRAGPRAPWLSVASISRLAEPRAPWPSVAVTAEQSDAKAPCEVLTARAEAAARWPGVGRLVPREARLKAASDAHRPGAQHREWTPEELSRAEPAKKVLSCLESVVEVLWCQVPKRAAVLRPEWTPEAVSRPGSRPVDLAAVARQAADLAA